MRRTIQKQFEKLVDCLAKAKARGRKGQVRKYESQLTKLNVMFIQPYHTEHQ